MKIKSYNILFRLFSFLSDKTNGAPLFVKYKLMLGTLILSLTSVSAYAQKEKSTEDLTTQSEPNLKRLVTCYDIALPDYSIVVEGSIKDENGNEIIGASISVKGKTEGTMSDIDGNYSLEANINDSLVFTCLGYETLVTKVSDIENIDGNIVMKEDSTLQISCYIVVEDPQYRNLKFPEIPENTKVSRNAISPEGDIESFQKWVQDNVVYSDQMRKEGLNGKLTLSFDINEKGQLKNQKVVESLSKKADKEVLRVLSTSERWQPAIHNGKPIKSSVFITILFDHE